MLDSALAAPRATFGGELLHRDVFEVAAAYAYHIIRNHPYMDANKRLGMMAAIVFLRMNRKAIALDEDGAYEAGMAVAEGRLDIAGLAARLRGRR